MAELDFESLFAASPNPYALLDPAFRIVAMNDAYLRVAMRRREDLLGRNMFEALPGPPGSESHRQLRSSLEKVLRTGLADHIPLIHDDIASPHAERFGERYWSVTHTPVGAGDGAVRYILQHMADVSELQRWKSIARSTAPSAPHMAGMVERAAAVQLQNRLLKDEGRRLRALFSQAPGFVAILSGPSHVFTMTNHAYQTLIGNRQIIGRTVDEALPEVVEQGFVTLLDKVYATRQPFIGRNARVLLRASSDREVEERFLDFVYQPILDDDGQCTGIFVQGQDVTEQKRATGALRESEERFRLVAETAPVMLWMMDGQGGCTYFNEVQRAFFALGPEEVSGFDWVQTIHPEDRDRRLLEISASLSGRTSFSSEARFRRCDGQYRALRTEARPRFDASGHFIGLIGVNVDVNDHIVERERRLSLLSLNDRFREAREPEEIVYAAVETLGRTLHASRVGYGVVDHRRETVDLDPGWADAGVAPLAGRFHFRDFGSFIDDLKQGKLVHFTDSRKDPRTMLKREALDAIGVRSLVNVPVMEKGVIVALLFIHHASIREWSEEELAFVQEVAERTRMAVERRRAEQDLQELAAALETKVEARTAERDRVWRNSRDILLVALSNGSLLAVNPAWQAILGLDPEAAVGRNYLEFVWPEDAPRTREALERARLPFQISGFENRFRHADGTPRWISWQTSTEGDFVFAYGRDITAEKVQKEALRQAEEQLRQAQKMETLGQLTGGVAHDFNNLLQVISGNLQLLGRDVAENARAERRVQQALDGVGRGAKLASQLLAFGRRQPLEPKVLHIGKLLDNMSEMLRRTLGEATEIALSADDGLWNTLVDPVQIENAVLNLAINGRDAMNGAGLLTIAARNYRFEGTKPAPAPDLASGDYIELSVTDTGRGIPPDVLPQVFEPFFSTKPLGKGTGLGLSMVYGFVRQSGGHVVIDTELAKGTTVRLYLPRIEAAEEPLQGYGEAIDVTGGSETVLVAEDDDAVRAAVVDMLAELGYRVLTARDAASALDIVENDLSVDLLFTDVVMPGPLKSTQLVEKVKSLRPGLAVLFTSGYTENSIVHGGRLDPGVELLSKPYTRDQLARKIRLVLGSRPQPAETPVVQAASSVSSPDAAPLTVLLVEDDMLIRLDTAEILSELGCRVLEAGNAEQALSLMESESFDVLFTDLGLPGLSGGELAARVRCVDPQKSVIFATGNSKTPEIEGTGGCAILVKPYSVAAIENALRHVGGSRSGKPPE